MGLFDFLRKTKPSTNAPTPVATHEAPAHVLSIFDLPVADRCKYRYSDVKFIKVFDYPNLCKGSIVALINRGSLSSPSICAVVFDNSAIGYQVHGIIYPSKLEQMIADWFDRDWFIGAQISDISDSYVYLNILLGEFPSDEY